MADNNDIAGQGEQPTAETGAEVPTATPAPQQAVTPEQEALAAQPAQAAQPVQPEPVHQAPAAPAPAPVPPVQQQAAPAQQHQPPVHPQSAAGPQHPGQQPAANQPAVQHAPHAPYVAQPPAGVPTQAASEHPTSVNPTQVLPTEQLQHHAADAGSTAGAPHGLGTPHGLGASAAHGAGAPAAGGAGGPGGTGTPGAAFGAASRPAAPKKSHSTGTLLAGLAVAALVGGLVGGGVSSLVVANSAPRSSGTISQQGTVKLSNPENATDINGVAAVATPSVVTISVSSQTASGSGSGVIFNSDGYIITNAHVVTLDGAATNAKVRVKLSDGRMYDGKVVGVAPYSDIAVVKIDADNLTPIEVADSNDVNVGDRAVAIGAPLNLSNTVTSGVVSALNRGISVGSPLIPQDQGGNGKQDQGNGDQGNGDQGEAPDNGGRGFPWDFRFDTPGEGQQQQQATGGKVTLPVIQTDASINPGNSGGALLNGEGKLIGINVAIASPGASDGTASSAGLGFAIPSDLAVRVANEIIKGEKPSHGMLGASVADAGSDPDANATHAGGLIKEVVRGGAAADAGLRVGDIITGIDGIPANDGTSVSALVRMHAGGSKVKVDYIRDGQPGQVEVTLGTLDW